MPTALRRRREDRSLRADGRRSPADEPVGGFDTDESSDRRGGAGEHALFPRTALLAGLTVVLLAAVAIGSRGVHVGTVAPRGGAVTLPEIPNGVGEYLILLGAVGVTAIIALVAWVFAGSLVKRRREGTEVVPRSIRPSAWMTALVAFVMASLVAIPIALLLWARGRRAVRPPPFRLGHLHGSLTPVSPPPPWRGWTWGPALLVAATISAVALVSLVARRRRPEPAKAPGSVRFAELVRRSIDDIRRDPDPRHAVIAAYTRMEEGLEDGGWPRRPSRAPFEYIEEALERMSVPPKPTRSLTELFEIARFSARPVDEAMKERAIAALAEVDRALREPAP